MVRSQILSSYLLSSVIHVSAAGLAFVGWAGGFVPPGYGIQAGGNPGAGGTINSPYLESPFDFGEVATLKGDDGTTLGFDIKDIDPTALDVLKIEPTEVVVHAPAAHPRKPVEEPRSLIALANPIRLTEPIVEAQEQPKPQPETEEPAKKEDVTNTKDEAKQTEPQPQAEALKPQPESKPTEPLPTEAPATPAVPVEPLRAEEKPQTAKQPTTASEPSAPVAQTVTAQSRPSAEPPPEPEQLAERPSSTPAHASNAEATSNAQAKAESAAPSEKSGTSAARKGEGETGKLAGGSKGQALQATMSAASVASPGDGLPPGGRPDQYPSKLPLNPPPLYPTEAYEKGQEGVVQLLVSVTGQGTVATLKVHRSSGVESLDQAALKAVRDWKFQPATYRGRPVASKVLVPVGFQIER